MERKKWIDITKGIGIILVVLGHSNLLLTGITDDSNITKYIYSFHMPLFFYISGYLYSPSKYKNFKELGNKKFRSLIIPYIYFSLLAILFDIVRFKGDFQLTDEIFNFFYIGERVVWNDPLWYLVCLFFIEVIFYWIAQIKNNKVYLFTLLLSSLIGYWLSYENITLPFGISIALVGITFYGIGYFVSNINLRKINIVTLGICLPISILIPIYLNKAVSVYFMQYGNLIYFFVAALASIFLYIEFSKMIENSFLSRIFQYFGKNSLIILCTHFTILVVMSGLINRIPVLGLDMIKSDLIKGLIYTLLILVISIPVIYIIKKYFPWVLGNRRKKTVDSTKVFNAQ